MHMPLPTIHSASTAVAGFVIAAYWLVYVVVIGLEAAFPATFTAPPREAAQVCEGESSHNERARDLIGFCGSIENGEAAAEVDVQANRKL
jgi:hypothetical protein